jgi:molybdate transport system substrate-binding protein
VSPSRRGTAVRASLACLAASLLAACGGDRPARDSITVYAAASLRDVLPAVARAWESQGGLPVRFSFDATSRIVPQVLEGAPADAVVCADAPWMDALEEAGMVAPGSRVAIATNELVFVTAVGRPPPESPAGLPGDLAQVALAGENVPAGRYARAALETAGVWGAVEPRVVRAGDVRLALAWVSSGEADGGVVYRTDARSDPRVAVAFAFPAGSHPPVAYPAAVVRGARRAAEAVRFLGFCAGSRGAAILREHGFLPGAP